MSGTTSNDQGYATLADLCMILDQRPSDILGAVKALGMTAAFPLFPGTDDPDGLFDAAQVEQLRQAFVWHDGQKPT